MSEWDAAAELLLAGKVEELRNLPPMATALRRAEVVREVQRLVKERDLSENSACAIVARREGLSVPTVRGWWFRD